MIVRWMSNKKFRQSKQWFTMILGQWLQLQHLWRRRYSKLGCELRSENEWNWSMPGEESMYKDIIGGKNC